MRVRAVILLLVLAVSGTLSTASADLRCEASPVAGVAVAPGQGGITLVLIRFDNDGAAPAAVSGLAAAYTGDDASDIGAASAALEYSSDQTSWAPLVSGVSFSGGVAAFSGFSWSLDPAASGYLRVTASVATAVADGRAVDASVDPGTIAADAPVVPASSPLDSLDNAAPYRVRVTASRMHIEPVAAQTSGVAFSVSLYATDDYGNLAVSHAGSVTTISAAAGLGPSPDGQPSTLPVTYHWTGSEAGRAQASVTSYCAGTGQRLHIGDSLLTGEYSASFAVACGAAARYETGESTAASMGYPVALTVRARDQWGNLATGYGGNAAVTVSDTRCVSPATVDFAAGEASFTLVFHTAGSQQVRIKDASNPSLSAGLAVAVTGDAPPPQETTAAFPARAWPTLFNPRAGPLRIRYFLKENHDVTITIYTLMMDAVREIRAASGGAGGFAGVNELEWDGRGGDGNAVGHSGGYHIRIDKGYAVEWTGAVIRNR